MNKVGNAIRPDAQAFDEVRIITVPRYKTSGLSGDEWRISARVEFYRKGELKHEASYSKVDYAVGYLFAELHTAISNGKANFGGDGVHCDQEGCNKLKTITYRKLKDFCNDGREGEVHTFSSLRNFCDEHKTRGDCALDDADRNYEIVEPKH